MNGVTIKQANKEHFWKCLEVYKKAFKTGENFVAASLNIHAARGAEGVPESWGKYVRAVWK